MPEKRFKEWEKYKIKTESKYDWDFIQDQEKLLELIKKEEKSSEEKEKIKKLNQKIFLHSDNTKKEVVDILSKEINKELIWKGQDNLVYLYNSNYVVKFLNQKAIKKIDESVLEFFRKKYQILKKYIWEEIPTSYFFLGEVVNKKPIYYSNLWNYEIIYDTIYTFQKRVKWFTLSDMPIEKKQQEKEQVKNLHKKYIDLKLLIAHGEAVNWLELWSFNIKMDLGRISKKYKLWENFDITNFKTPNIMYDFEKEKMFLVDFDVGSRDEKFENLFKWLMNISEEESQKIIETRRENFEKHFLTLENGKKINKKYLKEIYQKYIKNTNI